MEKLLMFKNELNYITSKRIRESAEILINLLPDYFFKVPASSSGKYHPEFASGEKGLVRHTKVVVRIAYELLYINGTIGENFTQNEKDLILLSLIIHDGLKLGNPMESRTRKDHPILIANLVEENRNNIQLTEEELEIVKGILETHMGEWNKDRDGKEIMRKPTTKNERFAHMCDYLGSRKFLDVEFTDNEINY